jgi:hypothetical protein
MADDFRHVSPGDELSISARAWNTLLDVARSTRTGAGSDTGSSRQSGIIKVKNESGGPLPRNAVLGIEDPIFTPGDSSLNAFMREVAFRAKTPDIAKHKRRFCVLLDPAPLDGVVRAYLAGVCPVQVDVGDESHEYATIVDADATHLTSSRYGYAQILWREGDEGYGYGAGYTTGLQWAVVRLGAHCPSVAVGKASGGITARSGTTYGTGSVDIYRAVGGSADGPVETVEVLNPGTSISSGKYVSVGWDMDGTAWVAPLEC